MESLMLVIILMAGVCCFFITAGTVIEFFIDVIDFMMEEESQRKTLDYKYDRK